MNANLIYRGKGFALMDAMIAIVVIGIGLFGIVRLNSVMLGGTAIGKTRAEATQLAEGKLEEIRAQQPPATKPVSSTSPERIEDENEDYNQVFFRSWKIDSAGLTDIDLDRVRVCVSWGSATPEDDPCDEPVDRKVELNSLLSWTDLITSGNIGSGQGGVGAGMPETPGGRGRESGEVKYTPNAPPAGAVSNPNDGTSIYQHGGKTELIETATGRVLLTIEDGSNFSTISGKVYITWGSKIAKKATTQIDMDLVNTNVRVLGSLGSVCRQYLPGGVDTLPLYPSSGTEAFSYFYYTCYMGAGWWGNIAVVRFDGGDRVCLGDPKIAEPAKLDTDPVSRHPFLSTLRNYRGFTEICGTSSTSSACKSTGIGLDGSVYKSVSYGSSATAIQHHFLLTTITGQPTNTDCATNESEPSLDSNPFTSIIGTQGGNAGLLFCLSSTCPFGSGFITSETNFAMTISTSATTVPIVKVDGGRCSPRAQTASSFEYECLIDWIGWSGDYWSGNIEFSQADGVTSAGQISGVTTSEVSPNGKIVTLGGTSGIGCEGECITFSSVPKDVTSFALSATLTP